MDNMNDKAMILFEQLFESYPALETCRADIERAFNLLSKCYSEGGKVLVCGNGGSASDSEHIVGELMKGFLSRRHIRASDSELLREMYPEDGAYLAEKLQGALPAISLVSHSALSSAFINDVAADMVFAQQVYGYGRKGDAVIGISTSGNSGNVLNAIKIARTFGLSAIGLTGQDGGLMKKDCTVTIRVPARETYRVQELQLPVYHSICAMLEAEFFEE
jgi:D-sedoheptulose 7-phosphate isomerase